MSAVQIHEGLCVKARILMCKCTFLFFACDSTKTPIPCVKTRSLTFLCESTKVAASCVKARFADVRQQQLNDPFPAPS
jgi:hypothetical protein